MTKIETPETLLADFNAALEADIAEARQAIAKLSGQFADEPISSQVTFSERMLRQVGIFDALRDAQFEFAEIDDRGLANPQMVIVRKLQKLTTLMANVAANLGRDSHQRVEGRLTALRVLGTRLGDLSSDIEHAARVSA